MDKPYENHASVNGVSAVKPSASNSSFDEKPAPKASTVPRQPKPLCRRCGKPLHPDEIGLTKKLINRGATEFFCLPCLAACFQVSEDDLRQKIRDFRTMGCTLFP